MDPTGIAAPIEIVAATATGTATTIRTGARASASNRTASVTRNPLASRKSPTRARIHRLWAVRCARDLIVVGPNATARNVVAEAGADVVEVDAAVVVAVLGIRPAAVRPAMTG